MSCGGNYCLCESTLERMERNALLAAMLDHEDRYDDVLTALAGAAFLNKFQVKKLRNVPEKSIKIKVEVLLEELFSDDNFSLSKFIDLFKGSTEMIKTAKEALIDEISVHEIEAKVRRNSHSLSSSKHPTKKFTSSRSHSSNNQQLQQPARPFTDGDRKVVVNLVKELTSKNLRSLKMQSKAYEEESLGVWHHKSVIRRNLSDMTSKLEKRLVSSGYGERVESSPGKEKTGSEDAVSFYKSPQPVDEFVEKFLKILEEFLKILFAMKGKPLQYSPLGNI